MSHENYSRVEKREGSSDRSFGLLFAALFLLLTFSPLLSGASPRYWSAVVSGMLLAISMCMPSLLTLPNRGWTLFGALLHKIMNPLLLAALFFLVITPYSIVMRIFRKDQLGLERQPSADSYWQKRTQNVQDMKRQF